MLALVALPFLAPGAKEETPPPSRQEPQGVSPEAIDGPSGNPPSSSAPGDSCSGANAFMERLIAAGSSSEASSSSAGSSGCSTLPLTAAEEARRLAESIDRYNAKLCPETPPKQKRRHPPEDFPRTPLPKRAPPPLTSYARGWLDGFKCGEKEGRSEGRSI